MMYLHTKHSSVLINEDNRCPAILYYGPRLKEDDNTEALLTLLQPALPQGGSDERGQISIVPSYAEPTFMTPSVRMHQQRKFWAPQWQKTDQQADDNQISFTLEDPKTGLTVKWQLTSHAATDVFTIDATLENQGQQTIELEQWLTTLPVPATMTQATSFTGRWIQEFQPQHHHIDIGTLELANLRGRTSHDHFPGLIISHEDRTETQGHCIGMHLGWSGNHCQRVERSQNGLMQYQAGPALMPGEISLEPGNAFTAPTLYFTYSEQGLAGIAEHFQPFVREVLLDIPDNRPRPVHINTWEALYFNHQQEELDSLAQAAHEIGAERYVLDDGWFPARRNDTAGLGDWVVDTGVYPEGFRPLVKTLQDNSLSFGLWFEPEMINKESQLYRDHPDWILQIDGQHQASGRNQWVLDITRDEVKSYLIEHISALLNEYPIEYIKWDMNRDLLQAGNQSGQPAYYQYVLSLYQILETLRNRFPAVEIESCSSGGGRMDYGILRWTQRFWLSDCNDAHERQIMQQWASLFFPAEVLGSHIGPTLSHTTSRSHPLSVRAGTALFGHMGIEWDVREATSAEKQQLLDTVNLYKQWRSFIHSEIRRPLTMTDPGQIGFRVGTGERVLVSVFQRQTPRVAVPSALRVPELDPDAQYRLTPLLQPGQTGHLMKQKPDWMRKPEVLYRGDALMQMGIALPVLDPESLLVIAIEKS